MKVSNIIHLRGMEFYAYHGVLEEEKVLGQRFVVDVDLYPLKQVKRTDNLADTINYADIYQVVKECVEKECFQLLESLADRIVSRLYEEFECSKVRAEVHKPQAPVPGLFADISIEVMREK